MAKQCWDNRHRKWAENKKLKNVKASTNLKRKFPFESWLTESKINNLLSLHGKKINGPSYDFGYRVFRYKRSQLASFYLWVDLWHLRVCGYAGMQVCTEGYAGTWCTWYIWCLRPMNVPTLQCIVLGRPWARWPLAPPCQGHDIGAWQSGFC